MPVRPRRPSPHALPPAARAFSSPCADPAGAHAALGPHLCFGSRDTRGRCARGVHGAGARESPPGVRRGHALPGAGGEATRLPGALLFPPPSGSQSPRLGPPPPCPTPGDARGPAPRDPGRGAARRAQPSSRVCIAPRPGRARLASPSARRAGAARAPRPAGPSQSVGAELGARGGAQERGEPQGPRAERPCTQTPSVLRTGEGAGRSAVWPRVGSARCRPRCNVSRAATPSRRSRGRVPVPGRWDRAPRAWTARGGRAGKAATPGPGRGSGGGLEKARGGLHGELGAALTQRGRGEKEESDPSRVRRAQVGRVRGRAHVAMKGARSRSPEYKQGCPSVHGAGLTEPAQCPAFGQGRQRAPQTSELGAASS